MFREHDLSPEASALWRWFKWSVSQLPAGKAPLLLNMDDGPQPQVVVRAQVRGVVRVFRVPLHRPLHNTRLGRVAGDAHRKCGPSIEPISMDVQHDEEFVG